jgi:predicted small lipoprotein YifL
MKESDMKKVKMSLLSVLAAVSLLGLVACEKEGPMEKAGKQVDEAVEKTEKAIKEKTE